MTWTKTQRPFGEVNMAFSLCLQGKCLSKIQHLHTHFQKSSPISGFRHKMTQRHHQHTPQPQQPSKTILKHTQYGQTHNTPNFFSLCYQRNDIAKFRNNSNLYNLPEFCNDMKSSVYSTKENSLHPA